MLQKGAEGVRAAAERVGQTMQAACRISQLLRPLPASFALLVSRLPVCPVRLISCDALMAIGRAHDRGRRSAPLPCNQVMMDLAPPEKLIARRRAVELCGCGRAVGIE